MMHDAHAHFGTPATPGLDAASLPAPPADAADDRGPTVWWTVVDFIRAAVEARANARLTPSPGTPGEGRGGGSRRNATRPVPHH